MIKFLQKLFKSKNKNEDNLKIAFEYFNKENSLAKLLKERCELEQEVLLSRMDRLSELVELDERVFITLKDYRDDIDYKKIDELSKHIKEVIYNAWSYFNVY